MVTASNEYVLFPGEWYFGNDYPSIQTLLGSCVAVTVWHPKLRYGGMCHYLLPSAPTLRPEEQTSWRYGERVLEVMVREMKKIAPVIEFQIGCFGGAQMFDLKARSMIGASNIECAKDWFRRHNLICKHLEVGGYCGRKVRLDVKSGQIEVAHVRQVPQVTNGLDQQLFMP